MCNPTAAEAHQWEGRMENYEFETLQ
jgi:hypothetical protein